MIELLISYLIISLFFSYIAWWDNNDNRYIWIVIIGLIWPVIYIALIIDVLVESIRWRKTTGQYHKFTDGTGYWTEDQERMAEAIESSSSQ